MVSMKYALTKMTKAVRRGQEIVISVKGNTIFLILRWSGEYRYNSPSILFRVLNQSMIFLGNAKP